MRAEPAGGLHVVVVVGDAVPARAGPQVPLSADLPHRQEITSSAAITPSTTNTGVYDPPPLLPADASRCPCNGRAPAAGKRGAVVEDMVVARLRSDSSPVSIGFAWDRARLLRAIWRVLVPCGARV